MTTPKRTLLVTTPIYYVNDIPHVGHAYTTIAADTLARAERLAGRDVFFLTGTDEHGQNIERIAREKGISEQEHCDRISAEFRSLWGRYDVRFDRFIRTTEDVHRRGVLKLWERLRVAKTPDGRDAVYRGSYAGWYCPRCEGFKDEEELRQPGNVCPDHERPCEWTEEENFFFRLSAYESWLKDEIESDRIRIRPDSRRNEVLGVVRQGLKDFSVSRARVKWGIPVPEQPDHVLYVWVDALSNYITALGFADDGEPYRHYWANGDERLHLIGKDIIRFHCLYWPAILHAAGVPVPTREFAQGFITKDGRKLSKTTGNVIDPVALVEKLGPDAARYFLLREAPYGADWDFTESAFVSRYNADLANDLGNLVSRAATMAARYCDGKVPARGPAGADFASTLEARAFANEGGLVAGVLARYAELDFAGALGEVWSWVVAAQPGDRAGRAVDAREGPGAPRRARGVPLPADRERPARGRARLARDAARRRRASSRCSASASASRGRPTSRGDGSSPARRWARSRRSSRASRERTRRTAPPRRPGRRPAGRRRRRRHACLRASRPRAVPGTNPLRPAPPRARPGERRRRAPRPPR